MPKLILQGSGDGQTYELPLNASFRIGRSRHNDLSLDHGSVSETHCELYSDALVVTVTDLGSTNGTFIDGQPVSRAQLQNGQVLQLGALSLVLEAPEHRVAIPEIQRGVPDHPTVLESGAACCYNHSSLMAAVVCTHCQKHFCHTCVHVVGLKGANKHLLCPSCHNHCNAYTWAGAEQSAGLFGGFLHALKKITGRFRN
jgi:FHA domain